MRRKVKPHIHKKKKKKIKTRYFNYHKININDKININNKKDFKLPNLNIRQPKNIEFEHIVRLGCINSNIGINDIVPININWPQYQNPNNFATGSGGPKYASVDGNVVEINKLNNMKFSNPTPFQSNVTMSSNVNLYDISATASGYGSITISQEGLLWTLWPLVKGKNQQETHPFTYFNNFTFGTSMSSKYPIGQMGYFYNNYQIACTPMTAAWVNPDPNLPPVNPGQPGMISNSPPMLPGIQGFLVSLLYTTATQVAIVVIKVGEEIARIFNPTASISSKERFVYVGYDAWNIFRTSFNPIGPMMTQTYITPQTVTGSIVKNNLNVVLPPNFPQTIYFKNQAYIMPNNANLFIS